MTGIMAETAEKTAEKTADLIAGDDLKAAALRYSGEMRARIEGEQHGLPSIFDSWCTRVLTRLVSFDPARAWEDSVRENALREPARFQTLLWDLQRLRQFLDRYRQGRFVEYATRERSGAHYHPRGVPLMKNVFDFAMYPALLAELRPGTIFEIGSGLGASAAWLADHLAMNGIDGRVHSVDRVKVEAQYPHVSFHHGDCAVPETLFAAELLCTAPHPWLVIEDAHHNVAAVIGHMHRYLTPGDYLIVEDSDIKREALRAFMAAHSGAYLVDTRFTDNFGRNATCAADSIFVRTENGVAG
jgi:cephalosporin hydroxylase